MTPEQAQSAESKPVMPGGRMSIGFERMWHILQAIDECLAKDAASCLEPVKDLELLQVENRFLWSTGTLFDWRDPRMADVVVDWVKTLIRRGDMSREEGRLLARQSQKRLKPQLAKLQTIARKREDRLDPAKVPLREPTPEPAAAPAVRVKAVEPSAQSQPSASPRTVLTPPKALATPPTAPTAPARQSVRPRPAPRAMLETQAMDYSPILDKLEATAKAEAEEHGHRLTLPNSVFSLLGQSNLPEEVDARLARIYLDPEGLELDAEVYPAGQKPPHTQFLQALAQRAKREGFLSPGVQIALWKLRAFALEQDVPSVKDVAERLVLCQEGHPEEVSREIVDATLADGQPDDLLQLFKRHRQPLPEKLLTRVAVLTTDQNILHALARREDLTQAVIERLLKKPMWRAMPDAKTALMTVLKSNPAARKLMSRAMRGLRDSQEAAA